MMNIKLVTLNIRIIVFCFLSLASATEASVTVSGRIIEKSTGEPLEYVNVVLLSMPDSAFVAGAVSNESGLFLFEKVNSGSYLLRVSHIGFETRLAPVEVSATPVNMEEIRLQESNTLKGIVVTSKLPPFQAGDGGGIVANVSTTLLSSVGTASDVLQRMPGVAADNGAITVFGKGVPIVYINNRKVRDISELQRLESSEISTVELISNPGAKYDAEGRAVLLIKTKRKLNGFSAQLTERLRQGEYLGDNENISVSYTKDQLNLFATYYHDYGRVAASEDHYFTLKNADGVWRHNTFTPGDYINKSHQVSAGFDLSINEKQVIGGQYRFYTGNVKFNNPFNSSTYLNDVPYETSQAQSWMKNNDYEHLANAFYNGDFGDRFSLRFDFDYLKNHDERDQESNETIDGAEKRDVKISNQTDYDLYAGKLTGSWKTGAGLVESGGEYNHISGSGFVRSNGYTDNSKFTNTEQKVAGFVSYSHKLADFHVNAGLRYEFTSEQYTEGELENPVIDRTYSDLYPNVSVSRAFGNVDLNLAFGKRTQRPNFTQLNGNVIYVNRFVFQKGDPYLNKTNLYDMNLQATVKPFYLNVGYVYGTNPVLLYFKALEEESNAILSTYANFPKYEVLHATLNFNHKIASWQPNYTVGVEQPFFSATYDGQEIRYDKVSYFFRAYNDFTLPLAFVLSCNYRYQSDKQDAFFGSKSWHRIDLGLRKSFLGNSLRFNLMLNDVFDWVKAKESMQIDNLQWNVNRKRETRYATLSVTWMFNNYQKKYRGGSAAQDDINRF
jgi:hypothetical protein